MGNGCYRRTQLFGAGHPAKQVVIKLAAADAVTDHFTVVVLHRVLAHHADAEAANGLQGAAIAILVGINIQACQYRGGYRSEEHTSELQSRPHLVCRLLLEK